MFSCITSTVFLRFGFCWVGDIFRKSGRTAYVVLKRKTIRVICSRCCTSVHVVIVWMYISLSSRAYSHFFGHSLPGRVGTCLWNSTWRIDKKGKALHLHPERSTHLQSYTLIWRTFNQVHTQFSEPHNILCREIAATREMHVKTERQQHETGRKVCELYG